MNFWTLCRFLVGGREAIRSIAATKSALWLGLVFVVSAGFAREYDGEDLLREPWHLALPLTASLVTSLILFLLVCKAGGLERWDPRSFAGEYRRFLALYWMTAPLAWLYALPVDRWMSAAGATESNLLLLGIVAAWRVILTIRIVSVVYGTKWYAAIPIVMLFADAVALAILIFTPTPIIAIMGGVRLTVSELIIRETKYLVGALGVVTLPIWLIGSIVVSSKSRFRPRAADDDEPHTVGVSTWLLGVAALLVWIPILPVTQVEQQLRVAVERDLRSGHLERALTTMSQHERSDFPPHWAPPPRIGYGERTPAILDVTEAIVENNVTGWTRELFRQKLENSMGNSDYGAETFWGRVDNNEFDRYLHVIDQLPASPEFFANHRKALELQAKSDLHERTDEQKERLRQLLAEIGEEPVQ